MLVTRPLLDLGHTKEQYSCALLLAEAEAQDDKTAGTSLRSGACLAASASSQQNSYINDCVQITFNDIDVEVPVAPNTAAIPHPYHGLDFNSIFNYMCGMCGAPQPQQRLLGARLLLTKASKRAFADRSCPRNEELVLVKSLHMKRACMIIAGRCPHRVAMGHGIKDPPVYL